LLVNYFQSTKLPVTIAGILQVKFILYSNLQIVNFLFSFILTMQKLKSFRIVSEFSENIFNKTMCWKFSSVLKKLTKNIIFFLCINILFMLCMLHKTHEHELLFSSLWTLSMIYLFFFFFVFSTKISSHFEHDSAF
jgi:hypothetical protein